MVFCSSCQFCTQFRSASPLLHIELRSVQEQHARERGRVKKGRRCKICVGDPPWKKTRSTTCYLSLAPPANTNPCAVQGNYSSKEDFSWKKRSPQCSSLARDMFVVGWVFASICMICQSFEVAHAVQLFHIVGHRYAPCHKRSQRKKSTPEINSTIRTFGGFPRPLTQRCLVRLTSGPGPATPSKARSNPARIKTPKCKRTLYPSGQPPSPERSAFSGVVMCVRYAVASPCSARPPRRG